MREAPTGEPVGSGGDGGEKLRTRETLTAKTAETPEPAPPKREPTDLSALARRKLEQASEMGLVAMWSRHHGYVSVHDPTTGEWHDLRTEDAPDWAVGEARRRKPRLARKGGGG